MDHEFVFDPDNPDEAIEMIARAGHERLLMERVAKEREHELDPDEKYWGLTWQALSDERKAPYRATAAEAFNLIEQLFLEP